MICMLGEDLGQVFILGVDRGNQHLITFSRYLPARFDWSIMGCTILLLALMNLAGKGGKKREEENKC